jgi:hypothetical protein
MNQSAEGVLLTNDAPKAFAMNQSAEGVCDVPRAEGVCDERSAEGAARR